MLHCQYDAVHGYLDYPPTLSHHVREVQTSNRRCSNPYFLLQHPLQSLGSQVFYYLVQERAQPRERHHWVHLEALWAEGFTCDWHTTLICKEINLGFMWDSLAVYGKTVCSPHWLMSCRKGNIPCFNLSDSNRFHFLDGSSNSWSRMGWSVSHLQVGKEAEYTQNNQTLRVIIQLEVSLQVWVTPRGEPSFTQRAHLTMQTLSPNKKKQVMCKLSLVIITKSNFFHIL